MNDFTYYSVVEAEDLGTFAKTEVKISNPVQTLVMMLFLISLIWISSWNTYKFVLSSPGYRHPWRMKVTPLQDGSLIQFTHAHSKRFSPKVKLHHEFSEAYDVECHGHRCQIPGVDVKLMSDSSYPDVVRVMINDNVFIVYPEQMIINDETYSWYDTDTCVEIDSSNEGQSPRFENIQSLTSTLDN